MALQKREDAFVRLSSGDQDTNKGCEDVKFWLKLSFPSAGLACETKSLK